MPRQGVAVALNPVPVADLLAAAALDAALVMHLGKVYGMPLTRREAGQLILTICAQLAALMGAIWGVHLVASALKVASIGVSTLLTAGAQGALAWYATQVVGRAAGRYLVAGKSWGDSGAKRAVEHRRAARPRSILREARNPRAAARQRDALKAESTMLLLQLSARARTHRMRARRSEGLCAAAARSARTGRGAGTARIRSRTRIRRTLGHVRLLLALDGAAAEHAGASWSGTLLWICPAPTGRRTGARTGSSAARSSSCRPRAMTRRSASRPCARQARRGQHRQQDRAAVHARRMSPAVSA